VKAVQNWVQGPWNTLGFSCFGIASDFSSCNLCICRQIHGPIATALLPEALLAACGGACDKSNGEGSAAWRPDLRHFGGNRDGRANAPAAWRKRSYWHLGGAADARRAGDGDVSEL
jgi:hypothetical protein